MGWLKKIAKVAVPAAAGFATGGIGAAAVGALSGLGGDESTAQSADFAREMQQKQLDWERERAQNAHQWEVEDLKAAGLNPILSANGGAQTGGIGAGSIDTTGTQNAGINAATGIQQIASAAQLHGQLSKQKAEVENMQQDTINKAVQKGLISEQAAKTATERNILDFDFLLDQNYKEQERSVGIGNMLAENKLTAEKNKNLHYQTELIKESIKQTKQEIENLKEQQKTLRAQGKFAEANELGKTIQTYVSSVTDLISSIGPLLMPGGAAAKGAVAAATSAAKALEKNNKK